MISPIVRAAALAVLIGGAAGAPLAAQPARAHALDVVHYDLSLDLPTRGTDIEGRAVLTVARRARADTLRLDLIALRVDSVLVDGRPTSVARDSATIGVPLPAGDHDTLTVAVRYGGSPRDGFIIRTDPEGRWTGFGDNWPQRARYWIPSVDEPWDKATVSWTVRAPSDRTVIGNGDLMEETPIAPGADGVPRTLTKWSETIPVPTYVMVIAAAPLAYYSLGRSACGLSDFGGCVRQSVYVSPDVLSFLPGPFAHAPAIVDFYAHLVAPFPYEHLAHVESSTRFGGMENATEIFYADQPFRDRTMGDGVIAHETAHQWFGDAVTPARFAELWLSEGFATYWAQLWNQHARGDSAFRAGMAELRDQIVAAPECAERPVRDTAQTNYLALLNANSYQKGAWVLHMLRSMLGDSVFFRGIRGYYEAHRNGNATTDDLRRALERASGRRLGWFFAQWVERPGWAELTTHWRYDRATHRVTLEVEQGTRFAPYRFPLVVEVDGAHGRARRVTVEVAAEHAQRVVLPLHLDDAPTRIVLDPDVELLATLTTR